MVLTNKQKEGLRCAVEKYKNGEKYVVISGYAGSGKTTLIKFIIEALHVDHSKVAYATFTGKAAEVLRKKGNSNAMTLHRLLYDHVPLPAGGYFRRAKPSLEYTIICVDEVSMVPSDMMELLFSHKCFVICSGDPAQLPPIDKNADNHLLDKPDVFLDEIMRQAQESEIIRVSMAVREGKTLDLFKGNEVQIIDKKDLSSGMLTWADEVLVAKNATRLDLNHQIRKQLNFPDNPTVGDKIVCLHNYWDIASTQKNALVNGTIGYIQDITESSINFPCYAYTTRSSVDIYKTNIKIDDTEIYNNIDIDKQCLLNETESLDWRDKYKLLKLRNRCGDLIPKQITYGYAITVWKAQGSEWDKILLLEENFPFDKKEHMQYLYTGITRAAEKLVIVKN